MNARRTGWRRRRPLRIRPRRLRLAAILLAFALLSAAYVVGMAAAQADHEPVAGFYDLLIPRSLDILIGAWFFFIGSAIGSFLNVVAWRLPQGRSINGRSHCPRCGNALRWTDNWPVFGWIVLGGRCRYCRLPISVRYPIVEAAVAIGVLFIASRLFFSDATNLPFWPKRFGHITALWMPHVHHDTLGVMVYQITAVASVWALGLVRFDGYRLPRQLVGWCFALVVIPILAFPFLAVVPWTVTEEMRWTPHDHYLNAVMRVLSGGAMGVLIARILARYLCPAADPKLDPLGEPTARLFDLIAMTALVGIIVGWQAALPVTALAGIVGGLFPRRMIGSDDSLSRLAIALPPTLGVQLAWWGDLHRLAWWPSVNTSPWVTLAWGASLLVLPRILVTSHRDRAIRPDPDPAVSD